MAVTYAMSLILTAAELANEGFEDYYVILAQTEESIEMKEPVFLNIAYLRENRIEPIGVTHLVHLSGKNWDETPCEAIARSVEEVKASIIKAVENHLQYKDDYFVTRRGVIIELDRHQLTVREDRVLILNGKPVTWEGKAVKVDNLVSEGIITVEELPNGHLRLLDQVDFRVGKDIIIDENNAIYRA